MKRTILSSLLLSVVLVSSAGAQTIYVDDDATGANDGSSWQDAFIYLQDALDAAHSGDFSKLASACRGKNKVRNSVYSQDLKCREKI